MGDRNRRAAEQELSDVLEQLSDATLQNQALQASKRKLESEMQTLHADLEEMLGETRLSEEKAKKAMFDASRLADELRVEQESAQSMERQRRGMEYQVKDMQTKLDEAETLAMKGGRKVIQRLEQKIRELESQLDEEQRRLVDAHKNHERMQELVDKFQNKVKTYKKQIEEAEEIAALNLAKFRKVQADLEEAEERADLNEQILAKFKARGRSATRDNLV